MEQHVNTTEQTTSTLPPLFMVHSLGDVVYQTVCLDYHADPIPWCTGRWYIISFPILKSYTCKTPEMKAKALRLFIARNTNRFQAFTHSQWILKSPPPLNIEFCLLLFQLRFTVHKQTLRTREIYWRGEDLLRSLQIQINSSAWTQTPFPWSCSVCSVRQEFNQNLRTSL